jgi:hypothetical protein
MNIKVCNTCGQSFPATNEYFSYYTNRRDGVVQTGLRGTCKKCMSKRATLHQKERPDLAAAKAARRRDRELNAEGYCTDEEKAQIRARLKDKCFYCGTHLNNGGHIDHMVPLSKGGSNWPHNLTLACHTCNLDKHGKTAEAFVHWRLERGLVCTREALALVKKKHGKGI